MEKYGYIDRVDYRSLKAQRKEALINGDTFLASLLDRIPEEHINPVLLLQEDNPDVENLKKYRAYKKEYQDLLYKTDLLQYQIKEAEHAEIANSTSQKVPEIILSDEFENVNSELLQELKDNLITALDDVNAWKKTIISTKDAEEKAMLGFMNESEREIWHEYNSVLKQAKDWQLFEKNLHKPNDFQTDALAAYEQILPAIKGKLSVLEEKKLELLPSIEAIKKRLSTANTAKKIQTNTMKILFQDKHSKAMLAKANEHLSNTVEAITQVLFDETINNESSKTVFTAKEIYDALNAKLQTVNQKINHIKIQLQSAKLRMKADSIGTKYKVKSQTKSNSNFHSVNIIANAMAGNADATQLIARFDDNGLSMEKDWNTMSEVEKDELKRKQLLQDI